MPFKIICSCGVALLAEDALANLKLACPECGDATVLPTVPDPYKLPTNAEMIPVSAGTQSKRKPANQKAKRKRGNAPARSNNNNSQQNSDSSTTMNIILIVVLIALIVAIAVYAILNN